MVLSHAGAFMEKKTCPKCKQTDHTDFSTCRNCGWTYGAVPLKMKSEHDDSNFGSYLRNGGLVVVLLAATWFAKPLLKQFVYHSSNSEMDSAVVRIERAGKDLERNPKDVDALLKRAHNLYVLGEVEAAAEDYNSAVALLPQSSKVYRERATFYESIGDIELAKKDRQQADKLGH
jgi:tetratricopeptide (TPR) repeat protein